ncbi:MAG: exonuclease domain-containing protein [bacterium]
MLGNVLICDVETTGLDPDSDFVIEIAAVGYNVPNHSVVEAFSCVVSSTDDNKAEAINHIPSAILSLSSKWPTDVWNIANAMSIGCDAVLAHNASFDYQWVEKTVAERLYNLPWIDTCDGITWPKQAKPGSSLISLALEHGLAVVDPHRALSDCLLLARLLTRCAELGHDVQAMLARGLRPQTLVQALVSFEERDKAKELGFHWDSANKRWIRRMPLEDCAALPFSVRPV